MTIEEIYDVIDKQGLNQRFKDDIESENSWLIDALRHALAMLDVAQVYNRECAKEWAEMESKP